jgi:hypothetical protein
MRWVARPLPHGRRKVGAVRALGFTLSRRSMHEGAAMDFLRAVADYELWPERRGEQLALPLHKELERAGETEDVYRRTLRYSRGFLSDILPQHRRLVHAHALDVIETHYMPALIYGSESTKSLLRAMTREANRLVSVRPRTPTRMGEGL